jgi:hypothetical protein
MKATADLRGRRNPPDVWRSPYIVPQVAGALLADTGADSSMECFRVTLGLFQW